jgi:hypothetical protein
MNFVSHSHVFLLIQDSVPPNVTFEIDDLEEDWTFSEKFDFIHSRMMTGALSNWRKLFVQAFE